MKSLKNQRLIISYLSKGQELSEDFIIQYKNKLDWHDISKYQKLSKNFIRKFKDK